VVGLANLIKSAGASPSGTTQAGQGAQRAGHKYLRREWKGDRWVYDYGDGQGLREAKGEEDRPQEAPQAPSPEQERKARAALAQVLDHASLPADFTVQTPTHTYTRTPRGGWEDEEGTRIGDGAALVARLERDTTEGKRGGALTLKQALWAFLEGAVPGSDPTWKLRAGIEQDPRAILAANRKEQARADEVRGDVREEGRQEQDKASAARSAELEAARAKIQEERSRAQEDKDKARTQKEKERQEGQLAKVQETVEDLRGKLKEAREQLKQREEARLLSRQLDAARQALEEDPARTQSGASQGQEAPQDQAARASLPDLNPSDPIASAQDAQDAAGLEGFDVSPSDKPSEGAAAVLRLVDDDLLGGLEGKDKLAALKKTAPDVVERLRGMLGKLGTQRPAVQQRIADVLALEGWNGSARAEMIGALLQNPQARRNASSILEAASSLASGGKVEPHHVAGAVAMQGGGAGGDAAWSQNVREVGQDAERELGRLQGLLAQARSNPAKAREALSSALSSGAIQKIATLARAFPGLQDKAAQGTRDLVTQAASLAAREGLVTHGAKAPLFVAGDMGRATSTPARYRLMEAHEAIPSHDPETWAKNGAYPEGIQERLYHSDKAEQHKVERNAENLEPSFVVNTNPDALNGPPIITPEGHVLGGNSRAMSMQLAYRQGGERARALRQHLEDNAHHFGFSPEDVRGMVNPILVREVSPEDRSPANMKRLVRQYNEGMTQGMDPKALSVALSSKLDDSHIHNLASQMEAGESLAEFLDSPRSRAFVEALDRAGVIDERNANAYKEKSGRLNADGRRLVERALVGKVVGDADLLHRLPESIITGLARAVPSLYQAEGSGASYNIRAPLKAALDGYATMHARGRQGGVGVPSSDASPEVMRAALSQLKGDLFGEDHPATADPRAAKILEALVRRPGSRQLATAFGDFAARAQANPEGQASLFGVVDPHAALHGALDRMIQAPAPSDATPQGEPVLQSEPAPSEPVGQAAPPEEKEPARTQADLLGGFTPAPPHEAHADAQGGQGEEDKPREENPNQMGLFRSLLALGLHGAEASNDPLGGALDQDARALQDQDEGTAGWPWGDASNDDNAPARAWDDEETEP